MHTLTQDAVLVVDGIRLAPRGRPLTLLVHRAGVLVVPLVIAVLAACASPPRQPAPGPSGTPPRTGAPARDPTRGQFINATSWALRVWVDPQPVNKSDSPSVVLQPGEAAPWTLSRGEHRIVAQAHSVSQAGKGPVARFDSTIQLDPKRVEGWYLRFREADFR